MHMQKNPPSRWTWSYDRKRSHSRVQCEWVWPAPEFTVPPQTWNPQLCFVTQLTCAASSWDPMTKKKYPGKFWENILVLFFWAPLFASPTVFTKADTRNILIKAQKDEKLFLVKLLQSQNETIFWDTSRQEAHQGKQCMLKEIFLENLHEVSSRVPTAESLLHYGLGILCLTQASLKDCLEIHWS